MSAHTSSITTMSVIIYHLRLQSISMNMEQWRLQRSPWAVSDIIAVNCRRCHIAAQHSSRTCDPYTTFISHVWSLHNIHLARVIPTQHSSRTCDPSTTFISHVWSLHNIHLARVIPTQHSSRTCDPSTTFISHVWSQHNIHLARVIPTQHSSRTCDPSTTFISHVWSQHNIHLARVIPALQMIPFHIQQHISATCLEDLKKNMRSCSKCR